MTASPVLLQLKMIMHEIDNGLPDLDPAPTARPAATTAPVGGWHRLPGDVYNEVGLPKGHVSSPNDASQSMPGTAEHTPSPPPASVRLPCGSGT